MCEFCTKHGEGKKWYLQAKNYNQELLLQKHKGLLHEIASRGEEDWVKWGGEMDKAVFRDPNSVKVAYMSQRQNPEKEAWGQVVPIEDVERILELSTNITRIPCLCRSFIRGVHNARFCFLMNVLPEDIKPLLEPPDISESSEVLTVDGAKKVFHSFDLEGQVHHVRTFPPFIYSICNCNRNECVTLKRLVQYHVPVDIYKAEYVSEINWDSCSGCRECMKLCNFGAISYSTAVEKCYINKFECYGCGVCRAACPCDAIALRDRKTIPAVANDW